VTSAIAIDPAYGKRTEGCALALVRDSVLADVWLERVPSGMFTPRHSAELIAWEQPEFQGARSTTAGVDVLVQLTAAGGMLAGLYAGALGARCLALPVSAWKGNEPKASNHDRLWAKLSKAERKILGGDATGNMIKAAVSACARLRWPRGMTGYPAGWLTHNKLDAVAMGMVLGGRLDRV
jgi:hypothetical protein